MPPSTLSDGRSLYFLASTTWMPVGGDGEVVDVRAGAGDAAVVEHAHPLRGEVAEPRTEAFLAEGAGVAGGRRLRVVADCEDEASEPRVLLADPRLALGLAALVPATR